MSSKLKSRTISALLWNTIDKVFSQLCYAVTGVVLANLLFPEDFGLIGVLGVFIAFASVFIDGGFTNALIQRKSLTGKDLSTIFVFNLAVSVVLYVVLWFCAPLIAWYFDEERLIDLSRVLFLSFIFLSFGMVQSSIAMRKMRIRKFALVNVVSMTLSSGLSLWLALRGYGVWALVFQQLAYSLCRSIMFWMLSSWRPKYFFRRQSFAKFLNFGTHVFLTSFINTAFQNIYTFLIAARYTMSELGFYTQADKWSKMGTMSLSQIINYSAFPALSSIQDERERMAGVFSKMNRMTSYLTLPAFIGLIVVATPLFHVLFGSKWDPSIDLFRLLIVRGVFFIYTSLLNNYILATGQSRVIFRLEIFKDVVALAAIVLTLPMGIPALVVGQVLTGIVHYAATAAMTVRYTGYSWRRQLRDMASYLVLSCAMAAVLIPIGAVSTNPYVSLPLQIVVGIVFYVIMNRLLNSALQREVFALLSRKGGRGEGKHPDEA